MSFVICPLSFVEVPATLDQGQMTKEKWLILETSGRRGQIALAQGEAICARRDLDEARRHARDLAPATQLLLAKQDWRPSELTGVIVSCGPGSYTGLRVGVISAKVWSYATGCAVLGVETFTAVASQAPSDAEVIEVLGDAQQDKVYSQRFARTASADLRAVLPLAVLPFTDWLANRDPAAWVTGPGMHRFRGRLAEFSLAVDPSLWDPTAESVLRIGLSRFHAGQRDDPWTLQPLYLRPSSAEEQWKVVTG
jgi:tRNA threonylcarbamoyladenosine biosynthesis protein TsaB